MNGDRAGNRAGNELRIGIAGLGTVGVGVMRLVEMSRTELGMRTGRTVRVVAVSARDRTKDRGVPLADVRFYSDPVDLAKADDVDLVVELIGGADGPALDTICAALDAGKPVVTANKALIAHHGLQLAGRAEERGVALAFEAAVAGGIPIIRTLRESLAGNNIKRVYGILNGTCNYILTRMEKEKLSYADCLKAAQDLGYAEADPTFDVEGFDTAHKLAILTSLAFGTEVAIGEMLVEGISSISTTDLQAAEELGYRIKLLGIASRVADGIEQRVHPTMVPKSSAIARVDGVLNAVAVEGDAVGSLVLAGPGAGGMATASSVMADIADVARGNVLSSFGRPVAALQPYRPAAIPGHNGSYYLRLSVYDRPGALAGIASRMADHDISMQSIVQRRQAPSGELNSDRTPLVAQTVVLITYATAEAKISAALDAIRRDGHIAAPPCLIRIEDF